MYLLLYSAPPTNPLSVPNPISVPVPNPPCCLSVACSGLKRMAPSRAPFHCSILQDVKRPDVRLDIGGRAFSRKSLCFRKMCARAHSSALDGYARSASIPLALRSRSGSCRKCDVGLQQEASACTCRGGKCKVLAGHWKSTSPSEREQSINVNTHQYWPSAQRTWGHGLPGVGLLRT